MIRDPNDPRNLWQNQDEEGWESDYHAQRYPTQSGPLERRIYWRNLREYARWSVGHRGF